MLYRPDHACRPFGTILLGTDLSLAGRSIALSGTLAAQSPGALDGTHPRLAANLRPLPSRDPPSRARRVLPKTVHGRPCRVVFCRHEHGAKRGPQLEFYGMSTAHDATDSHARARFRMERKPRSLRLVAEGEWTTKYAADLDHQLHAVELGDVVQADIDGSGLERIDSAGTWLLVRTKREWESLGKQVGPITLPRIYDTLL